MRRTRQLCAAGLLAVTLAGCSGSNGTTPSPPGSIAGTGTTTAAPEGSASPGLTGSTTPAASSSATPTAAPTATPTAAPTPPPVPGGSGIERLPVQRIVTLSQAAVRASNSVHAKGTFSSGPTAVTVDIVASRGGDGAGKVSANGLTFSVIRKGKSVYFRGDRKFNALLGPGAAAIQGRWLKAVVTDARYASITGFTDLDGFLSQIVGAASGGTVYALGARTTVSGIPAIRLVGTGGDAAGTSYLALVGRPYPLRVDPAKSAGSGSLRFDDWNKPVTVQVPPASSVVDLAKLGRPSP